MNKTILIAMLVVAIIGGGLTLFSSLSVSTQDAANSWGLAYLGSSIYFLVTLAIVIVLGVVGAVWDMVKAKNSPQKRSLLPSIILLLILATVAILFFI